MSFNSQEKNPKHTPYLVHTGHSPHWNFRLNIPGISFVTKSLTGDWGQKSALLCRFGEGAQLFGVDVLQLLQLSLSSPVQVLDVHHICLLDPGVHSEFIADSGYEARLVLPGPEELPVQGQDLLLQLAVPCH